MIWEARLDSTSGCWNPKSWDSTKPWIEYEFAQPMRVQGIETKGCGGANGGWATTYTVRFHNKKAQQWYWYGTGGKQETLQFEHGHMAQLFHANNNSDTAHTAHVKPIIVADRLRLYPHEWKGLLGMRVEVWGCPHDHVRTVAL